LQGIVADALYDELEACATSEELDLILGEYAEMVEGEE
jgi:hypothetical protein